ncbi:type I-C CRISPR-associated protein Cas8c/Csd1 [Amycolatopsis alba]|uniref:Type I-C CRISPR-associated protein Cas8c/Csd1 n=1 Tax=Amycolatopsis alba DSM 44262 TaxID=1125972 RepID=A0A229RM26_AMYAL|nr:type I-C CRISPR-associated protein Cas8c/Csd1 [Amycolatopsis alba]OXM47539.1 type I-C CRISPR-associated protein Cas8c/Csd1 [Amycolatopsis alba DSM 44262]
MLLQRLVGYAEDHVTTPPFHREREFLWRLDLFTDGRETRLTGLREPDGKRRGQYRVAPAVTRTVGVAPQLGADDVQYVFGWGDDTTKPVRVAECHTRFADLIRAWAEDDPHDAAASRVVRFYGDEDLPVRPEGMGAKDGVLIAVDDELVIRRPSLIRFWTAEVTRRKGGSTPRAGLCLVCGQARPLVKSMPGTVPKRLVPGAGNDAALVSVNASVFGYGLTDDLTHTPICFTCGNAVGSGLTHLLGSRHAINLPGQDSRMVWWVLGAEEPDVLSGFATGPDPGQVNALLTRLRSGDLARAEQHAERLGSDERFCSLTVGGNASRIMVRDWIDMPLPALLLSLARWYRDTLMVTTGRGDEPVTFGLWQLVLATGRWEARSGEPGRYTDIGSTSGRRREHVQRDLLARALRGLPLPLSVLHHVLHRIASDGHIDAARAALLRLALCDPREKESRVSAGLDENNTDTAYLYGRVFAHLENIQRKAHGNDVNATFGDKFRGSAQRNPVPAVMTGTNLATAWLSKIRRRPETRAAATALSATLDTLMDKIDSAEPLTGFLPPQRQAQFVLGYHQQRADDSRQARAHREKTDAEQDVSVD